MLLPSQVGDICYWLLLLGAFAAGMTVGSRRLRRVLPADASVPSLLLCVFVSGLIGARILWIIEYSSPASFWNGTSFWEGGMVFYGGFAGAIMGIYACAALQRVPFPRILDALAPCVALGEIVARVGCLAAGCCWGAVTNVPWAIRFPAGSHAFDMQAKLHMIPLDAPESLPVHPTQIYMILGLIAILAVLTWVEKRKRFDGQLLYSYLLSYGILRFIVEIFRNVARGGDSPRIPSVHMTISQAISLGLVVFGIAVLLFLSRRAGEQGRSGPGPAETSVSHEGASLTREDAQELT